MECQTRKNINADLYLQTSRTIHSSTTQIAGSYLKFKGKIWDICDLYSRSLHSKGDNSELVEKSVEAVGVIPENTYENYQLPLLVVLSKLEWECWTLSIIIRTKTIPI